MKSLSSLFLIAALLLAGCEKDSPAVTIESAETNEPQIVLTNAGPAQVAALAGGMNAFAFEMFKEISPRESLVISPCSISFAMGMLTAGSSGKTESELKEILCYPDGGALLCSEFKGLMAESVAAGEGFQFACANSLWLNEKFKLAPNYAAQMEDCFKGRASVLPLEKDPAGSAAIINKWVEERTLNLVKNLISAEALGPDTRLVLVNAVSFLAKWQTPFEASQTRDASFHLEDGQEAKVPMMQEDMNVCFAETNGVLFVSLPYEGGKYSMLILMPEMERQFYAVRDKMDEKFISGMESQAKREFVKFYLPKFEIETSRSLVPDFKNLGLNLPFGGQADFSKMSPGERLLVSDILHKAVIKVDEEGTKAAAATAVMMKCMGMMKQTSLKIDRPFVYAIRDGKTGAILFLGQYMGPKAK